MSAGRNLFTPAELRELADDWRRFAARKDMTWEAAGAFRACAEELDRLAAGDLYADDEED